MQFEELKKAISELNPQSIDQVADLAEELRSAAVFGAAADMADTGPIAAQHYMTAMNSLEIAESQLRLSALYLAKEITQ